MPSEFSAKAKKSSSRGPVQVLVRQTRAGIRFAPDAQIVHKTFTATQRYRRKPLKRWLGALDDFRTWLIREAA
jgi:hypothetical protein